jgi:diacylglycerol kinase (ATP)
MTGLLSFDDSLCFVCNSCLNTPSCIISRAKDKTFPNRCKTISFHFQFLYTVMANPNAKGVKRLINACFFSVAGFKATWTHEEAFRQEVILFVVTTPLAIWLGQTNIEKLLLIGSIVLVMLVELLNSAVEAVVDRVGLEHHELSGRAKDIGSAAVMMSLVWAAVTWALILL